MTTIQLKQDLLAKAYGGVMYNVTPGSDLMNVLLADRELAAQLADELDTPSANGIDKGLRSFINDNLAGNNTAIEEYYNA